MNDKGKVAIITAISIAILTMAITVNSHFVSADKNFDQSSTKFFKKCDKAEEKEDFKKAQQAEDQFKRHVEGGQAGCPIN